MSARSELNSLLSKAEVFPYRRVGKVRVAHNRATPPETLAAATEAVSRFAPSLVDVWGEPEGSVINTWRDAGYAVLEVCDDPCPVGVDPQRCGVAWLIDRAARYHFAFVVTPAGELSMSGLPDEKGNAWDVKVVKQWLPGWYVSACKERRPEIVAHVSAREVETPTQPEPSSDDSEGERCATCSATVYHTGPEVQRMCHMVTCPYWTKESSVGAEWMAEARRQLASQTRRNAG